MDILDESIKYFLLFLVGAFSGFINVIAGGGSMVTLPLLMGFGMPAPIANGTNRISILFHRLNNGEKRKCHHKMASFARCDGVIWSQRAKMT